MSEENVSEYDTEKTKVQSQLSSADGVALTVDFWMSVQNVSYMGVTAHYVSKKNGNYTRITYGCCLW